MNKKIIMFLVALISFMPKNYGAASASASAAALVATKGKKVVNGLEIDFNALDEALKLKSVYNNIQGKQALLQELKEMYNFAALEWLEAFKVVPNFNAINTNREAKQAIIRYLEQAADEPASKPTASPATNFWGTSAEVLAARPDQTLPSGQQRQPSILFPGQFEDEDRTTLANIRRSRQAAAPAAAAQDELAALRGKIDRQALQDQASSRRVIAPAPVGFAWSVPTSIQVQDEVSRRSQEASSRAWADDEDEGYTIQNDYDAMRIIIIAAYDYMCDKKDVQDANQMFPPNIREFCQPGHRTDQDFEHLFVEKLHTAVSILGAIPSGRALTFKASQIHEKNVREYEKPEVKEWAKKN